MYRSFFLGGFEGSTGFNRHGQWIDHVAATAHDRTVEQDYAALAGVGIRAARDTIRWPLVDQGRGRYDFSTVAPFAAAARRHGVTVIWDLFHYGFPRDVDLFASTLPARFAEYCYAAGQFIATNTDGPWWFTPVNEPSFFAYAGGEKGLFAPYATGRGYELKVALVRAAIAGIAALWDAAPGCRIVNVDPLCRVALSPARPWQSDEVDAFNNRWVFEAWDMLAGRLNAELGGSPAHLDIVGVNYYWTNQWEWGATALPDGRIPPLAADDPRTVKLSTLLTTVWRRYRQDLLLSETAHVGEMRGEWLREVARESKLALYQGVPLGGVCLYPILGMPEWHEPTVWTYMGLWDPVCHVSRVHERQLCSDMYEAMRSAEHLATLRDRLLTFGHPPSLRSPRRMLVPRHRQN